MLILRSFFERYAEGMTALNHGKFLTANPYEFAPIVCVFKGILAVIGGYFAALTSLHG